MAEGWAECPALGPGWQRREAFRKSGATSGRSDTYYRSPTGQKFRSKIELRRFLGPGHDLSNFDFKSGLQRPSPTRTKKGPKWHLPAVPLPEPPKIFKKEEEEEAVGGAEAEKTPPLPQEAPPPSLQTPPIHIQAPPPPGPAPLPVVQATPLSVEATPPPEPPPAQNSEAAAPGAPPGWGGGVSGGREIGGSPLPKMSPLLCRLCASCQTLFPGVSLPPQRRCRWLCPDCRAQRRDFNREQRFYKRVGCGTCQACRIPEDCGICSACSRSPPGGPSGPGRTPKCLLRRCLRIVKKGLGCGSCSGCLSTEDCGSCCICVRRLQPGLKRQWRCLRRRCLRPKSHPDLPRPPRVTPESPQHLRPPRVTPASPDPPESPQHSRPSPPPTPKPGWAKKSQSPLPLTEKWKPPVEREPSDTSSIRLRKTLTKGKEKKKPGRPPKPPGPRGVPILGCRYRNASNTRASRTLMPLIAAPTVIPAFSLTRCCRNAPNIAALTRGVRSRASRRCGVCTACRRPADCGRCDFCRDKPKFGGQNLKRQKCRWRQCLRCAMDKEELLGGAENRPGPLPGPPLRLCPIKEEAGPLPRLEVRPPGRLGPSLDTWDHPSDPPCPPGPPPGAPHRFRPPASKEPPRSPASPPRGCLGPPPITPLPPIFQPPPGDLGVLIAATPPREAGAASAQRVPGARCPRSSMAAAAVLLNPGLAFRVLVARGRPVPPGHEVLARRPPLRSVLDLVELLCDLEAYGPCPGPPGPPGRPPAPPVPRPGEGGGRCCQPCQIASIFDTGTAPRNGGAAP
ncbi:LOW QUALITY PROTEIN: methyl-CpG-binding domain protein 1-like [Acridotheres tristis]